MLTSEFINESRDEINAGWTQRTYRNDDDDCCVLGALDRVAMRHLGNGGIRARALAQKEIKEAAGIMFPDLFTGSITNLNDNHLTTKQDMLDLMDKASYPARRNRTLSGGCVDLARFIKVYKRL